MYPKRHDKKNLVACDHPLKQVDSYGLQLLWIKNYKSHKGAQASRDRDQVTHAEKHETLVRYKWQQRLLANKAVKIKTAALGINDKSRTEQDLSCNFLKLVG